jgi:DhnA family fructose-bisphosphate aldolase class Ia
VFQSKDPAGITRAIARILFDGASADDVYRG